MGAVLATIIGFFLTLVLFIYTDSWLGIHERIDSYSFFESAVALSGFLIAWFVVILIINCAGALLHNVTTKK